MNGTAWIRWCAPLVAAVGLSGCSGEAPARRPDVLLISIDTLRADHLSAYGYERETSPRIDALADAGALFEEAISSTSWTLPAHAALLTGLSDSVHGCTDTDRTLQPSRVTLAERLKDAGYATAGFFSGPYLHPVFGFAQGFDTYVDCTSYAEFNDERAASTGSIEGPDVWRRANDDVTNPTVHAAVSGWLDEPRDRPFFAFVHLWDCHFDFVPPPPYDTRFDPDYTGSMTGRDFFFDPAVNPDMPRRDLEHLIALYDGEIAWTDSFVGRFVDQLEELGVADDTLIVVTSDHGTGFFEHGLRAHRNSLFEELVHVPLVLRFPGRVPAGVRVPAQVRSIDVVPTVLELVGLPRGPELMGRSLVPLLTGEADAAAWDELAVSELLTLGQDLHAYRRADHKLILDGKTQRGSVYDLAADPGEQRPVTSAGSPLVRAAREDRDRAEARLRAFREALPAGGDGSEIPPDVLEHLKNLGYVGEDE